MESRKIRYQFDRLPMLLFIACLTITVVAGSVAKRSIMKKSSTQSQATEFSRDVFLLSVSVLIRLREETKYFLCFFLLCGFHFSLSLFLSLSLRSLNTFLLFPRNLIFMNLCRHDLWKHMNERFSLIVRQFFSLRSDFSVSSRL